MKLVITITDDLEVAEIVQGREGEGGEEVSKLG